MNYQKKIEYLEAVGLPTESIQLLLEKQKTNDVMVIE